METTNQPMPLKYGVYVQLDKQGRIININSDAHGIDLTGWIKIDEGPDESRPESDKFHHAQNNYFINPPLLDQDGCHNYYLVDGVPVQATPEQKAAELAARPVSGLTPLEELEKENHLLKAQVFALSEEQDFLTACLIEAGQVIYAE